MTESSKPISALRQRMIDDMAMRKLSPGTQRGYVRSVKHFFGRSPDRAQAEDLRRRRTSSTRQRCRWPMGRV